MFQRQNNPCSNAGQDLTQQDQFWRMSDTDLHFHALHERLSQACLCSCASKPQLVAVGPVSHKAKLSHVGPGAAIGAASHPDVEVLIWAKAQLVHEGADAVVDVWQASLCLSNGQTTQR